MASPRLPKADDFPSSIKVDIVTPPQNHPPTNALVLLHGLGDTNTPFTNFARAMALPDSCCISICAPTPLPFDLGGFHWGDGISFTNNNDSSTGGADMDAGFSKSTELVLHKIIFETLIKKCGYSARDVVLFGFGQGGMLALDIAFQLYQQQQEHSKGAKSELGGVVSIGAGLPSEATRVIDTSLYRGKCKTPVIVCKARDASAVREEDEDSLKEMFEFVEIKEWPRRGDGMPRNREEMLPIMQFFARRLRSRRGVPAGSFEIGT